MFHVVTYTYLGPKRTDQLHHFVEVHDESGMQTLIAEVTRALDAEFRGESWEVEDWIVGIRKSEATEEEAVDFVKFFFDYVQELEKDDVRLPSKPFSSKPARVFAHREGLKILYGHELQREKPSAHELMELGQRLESRIDQFAQQIAQIIPQKGAISSDCQPLVETLYHLTQASRSINCLEYQDFQTDGTDDPL